MEARDKETAKESGADAMEAKNQQSHVREIKINSFTLHFLQLCLFFLLNWRAWRVLSKCVLRKNRDFLIKIHTWQHCIWKFCFSLSNMPYNIIVC